MSHINHIIMQDNVTTIIGFSGQFRNFVGQMDFMSIQFNLGLRDELPFPFGLLL